MRAISVLIVKVIYCLGLCFDNVSVCSAASTVTIAIWNSLSDSCGLLSTFQSRLKMELFLCSLASSMPIYLLVPQSDLSLLVTYYSTIKICFDWLIDY